MRAEFDLDPGLIYLNSGTHSIVPRAVLEAITRYQRAYERNPTSELEAACGKLWSVQQTVAAMFGADPRDLFLRPNVTEAMNAFVLGMPLPAGGEILVTNLEYGAVGNLCRFRAERDGLALRTCGFGFSPREREGGRGVPETAESIVQGILAQLRPETRLLVVSHVMTGTGLVVPLAALARETRKRGVLLAVDGAHGPGGVPLDFSGLDDVDFYGGNLHKWVMGPKGTAFGWVPKRHQERIQPLMAGWTTFETFDFFGDFGGGSRFASKMMMEGCRDFAPFFALQETAEFWQRHGETAIRSRIYELQRLFERLFDERVGWDKVSPAAGDLRGPLLSYRVPESLAQEGPALARRIEREHGLRVAMPVVDGVLCLRVSPHVYNTAEEIEKGVSHLS